MDGGDRYHNGHWPVSLLFSGYSSADPSSSAVAATNHPAGAEASAASAVVHDGNHHNLFGDFAPLPLLILWVLCAVFYLLNDTIWPHVHNPHHDPFLHHRIRSPSSSSRVNDGVIASPASSSLSRSSSLDSLDSCSSSTRLLDKSGGSKFKVGGGGGGGSSSSSSTGAKKKFVEEVRKEVNEMKEKMGFVRLPTTDPDPVSSSRRPLLGAGPPEGTFGATAGGGGDQSDGDFFSPHRTRKDEQFAGVSQHRTIGEAVDQAIMIDDANNEAAVPQTRMDVASQKVAKMLGLSTERKQWMAIGGLTGFLVFIIILLFAI